MPEQEKSLTMPATASTLGETATLVRSKNAGPFWLTIDVFFSSGGDFERARCSTLSDPQWLAQLYGVAAEQIEIHEIPQLHAIKVSMPRPVVQGSLHDIDQHAGQQFVPLLGIPIG